MTALRPSDARALILERRTPPHLRVVGSLGFAGERGLQLPDHLHVEHRLDLTGCTDLVTLPAGLHAGALVIRGCTALEGLPEGISASFLDATGCVALSRWPTAGTLGPGHVLLRDCASVTELPAFLRQVGQLDVAGCVGLRSIPAHLEIASFLDVAGSGLTSLPDELAGVPLRYRGVPIDARIAFAPETITGEEILAEPNAELRRVKMARIGYERFLELAAAETLDRDRDPGGPRALLRVTLQGDEPLVVLSVICPSTARRYVLRVPPTTTTCHQAAAWIAGFDNPDDYRPIIET